MLVSHGMGGLVALLGRLGRNEAAATLLGAIDGTFRANPFVKEYPEALRRCRETLGDIMFEKMRRRGATMSFHEATDYAQQEIRQVLGELDEAASMTVG